MHKFFTISILLKGLNGVFEVVVGAITFFVPQKTVIFLVDLLTRRELLQDPADGVAVYLVHAVQNYSADVQLFIALYLCIHGILKIFLVFSLFQRRIWAYPTAMIVFSLFFVYQMYEYIHRPHISLIIISIIDVIVIILTYLEYRTMRNNNYKKPVSD